MFSKKQGLSSIILNKSGYDEKFTSEWNRFDSIYSAKDTKFFIIRAYFKRHVFGANFFNENQSFKWIFLEKGIRFWSKLFLQKETLKGHFLKILDCDLTIFRPGRFWKQNFSNILFVEKIYFLRNIFWIQFSLRNQISIKTSHLRNNVLTRFALRKTTSCSLFVFILKGMTL